LIVIDLLALIVLIVTSLLGSSIIIVFLYSKALGKNRDTFPDYKNRKDLTRLDPSLAHGHHEPHV
tara:strand:+ start:450 stop:644 length:195 start_codon:yes stop_codon:yes gene_type:complete